MLSRLRSWLQSPSRRQTRDRRKALRSRLGVEQLECRAVPTIAGWIGGVSSDWTDPDNWDSGHVVEDGDDLEITLPDDQMYYPMLFDGGDHEGGNLSVKSLSCEGTGYEPGIQGLIIDEGSSITIDGDYEGDISEWDSDGQFSGGGQLIVTNEAEMDFFNASDGEVNNDSIVANKGGIVLLSLGIRNLKSDIVLGGRGVGDTYLSDGNGYLRIGTTQYFTSLIYGITFDKKVNSNNTAGIFAYNTSGIFLNENQNSSELKIQCGTPGEGGTDPGIQLYGSSHLIRNPDTYFTVAMPTTANDYAEIELQAGAWLKFSRAVTLNNNSTLALDDGSRVVLANALNMNNSTGIVVESGTASLVSALSITIGNNQYVQLGVGSTDGHLDIGFSAASKTFNFGSGSSMLVNVHKDTGECSWLRTCLSGSDRGDTFYAGNVYALTGSSLVVTSYGSGGYASWTVGLAQGSGSWSSNFPTVTSPFSNTITSSQLVVS